MAKLGTFEPSAEAMAKLEAIQDLRLTPGMVMAFDGPEGHLGPEAAGCVMVLHATLADPDGAERFFSATEVLVAAQQAPGLIRFISFDDGFSSYAVGWWCTEEDARAFARGRAHREAVKEQYQRPFQYTQFAGLWGPMTVGHRDVYCEECGRSTRMPTDECSSCGNEVADVFKMQTNGEI